jgi:hypothetical protein
MEHGNLNSQLGDEIKNGTGDFIEFLLSLR